MGARWHTGRLLRVFVAPLLLGGVLTGLGSTAASAQTCQAWTGGQPANPNDTGSGDGLNGVAMINSCNVWAVGGTGSRTTLIEHWTGGSNWTVVPSPSPGEGLNFLTSVSGISAAGPRAPARARVPSTSSPAFTRSPPTTPGRWVPSATAPDSRP